MRPRLGPLSRAGFALILGVAVPTSTLSTAVAEPTPTARATRAKATGFAQAGLDAEHAGDYAAAVDWYVRAHDLVPLPDLLYNIAEAHRKAGHLAAALDHYRRYLTAQPDGRFAEDATRRVIELAQAVRIEQARQIEEARRAEEARLATEARLREAEAARIAADAARRAVEAREAEALRRAARDEQARRQQVEHARRDAVRRRGNRYQRAGAVTGVGGLVGVAGGIYYGQRASRLSDEVSRTFDAGKRADGEAAERRQVVALSVGAALVITGSVLAYVGWRTHDRASRLVVTPTVGGPGATVTWAEAW